MQLHDLDATAQAELVASGDVSPAELVEHAIQRIEQHNGELGAVIVPLYEQARADAADPPAGPFRGVPILIKDICALVKDAPYAAGLLPLKNAGLTAPFDSHLVAQLRRAGFIVVGKTNTSELGILPAAEPPAWPPTRNPYDTSRTSGGSSGGSASAVAAGLVSIAHANDGGGSIRIPAACCGLYGLKPSRGRVSFAPHIGDVNGGLVNEHVVTRSVRDSAAVLDILEGFVNGDPYAAPPPRRPYLAELLEPPRALRIGFNVKHQAMDGTFVDAHPDCVAAVHHTAKLLENLGHTVEEATPASLLDPEWTPRFLTLWAVGVTTQLDDAARMIGRPIEEHEVERLTWALAGLGRLVTGAGYTDAWAWVHRATRQLATFWDTYDIYLTPTTAEPPVPVGTFASPPDDPLAGIFRAGDFTPFTPPFNASGQPACSIPLYRSASGLPIGVHLVGAYGKEDLLLQLSGQLEAAQPFTHPATR